jgi:hypothetical protein
LRLKMKITKRQLKRVIREAITGTAVGLNRGQKFLDLTVQAMASDDYQTAADHIMNSLMIDDVLPEDESNLVSALSSLPTARRSPADLEAVADEWIKGIRREDQEWEDSEYKRGYQDALDLSPMADDATTAYDSGYEDGINDADQRAAEEILSTRMGSYRGTTLPGGKKIGEGTSTKDMPDSWRQILGNCLGDNK